MINKILFSLALIALDLTLSVAYALALQHKRFEGIDPAFQTEIAAYEKAVGHKVPHFIAIHFEDDLPNNAIGDCNMLRGEVRIKKSYWLNHSNTLRKVLILHELGHCDLNEDHRDEPSYWDTGCPASIMHPYIMQDYCFVSHEHYYISELLNHRKL